MSDFEMSFENEGQIQAVLKQAMAAIDKDKLTDILAEGAEIVRRNIEGQAPVGPTGNLRRSLVVRRMTVRANAPAVAIAAIDRAKAPHAWLVTHGTKGDRYATERARKVQPGMAWYWPGHGWVTNTGQMPANDFFDLAGAAAIPAAQEHVMHRISEALEGAFR